MYSVKSKDVKKLGQIENEKEQQDISLFWITTLILSNTSQHNEYKADFKVEFIINKSFAGTCAKVSACSLRQA